MVRRDEGIATFSGWPFHHVVARSSEHHSYLVRPPARSGFTITATHSFAPVFGRFRSALAAKGAGSIRWNSKPSSTKSEKDGNWLAQLQVVACNTPVYSNFAAKL
jgi:hypothetical protein